MTKSKVQKVEIRGDPQTKEDRRVFGDEYDVMQIGFIVHGKDIKQVLNEDFIIADLTDKERIFIRRGLKITYHIRTFLDVTRLKKERTEEIDGHKFKHFCVTEEQVEKIQGEADKIVARMLKNYQAMAILSRGKGGRMIKALIELIGKGGKKVSVEDAGFNKISPEEGVPS